MIVSNNRPGAAYTLLFLFACLSLVFSGCAHNKKSVMTEEAQTPAAAVEETPVLASAENPSSETMDDSAAPTVDDTEDPEWLDEEEPEWLDEEEPDWLEDEFDEEEEDLDTPDPLSGFNRAMYHVNDFLYQGFVTPVAGAYKALIPTKVRSGVGNFFTNLAGPLRFVNCLLQGKGEKADAEFVRFFMNSTIGVLGFGNPAGDYPELAPSEEDLGQTLATYGVGDGVFIFWPILGPSTLRDTVGMFGDRFMHPVSYVTPMEASYGLSAHERINSLSFRLGDYDSLKEAAIDPYEAFRDAYLQYRRTKIAE